IDRADIADAVSVDRHVSGAGAGAGAVDDRPASDDEVVHTPTLSRLRPPAPGTRRVATAMPVARLARGTGACRNTRIFPAWGASIQGSPTTSPCLGCQSSGLGLLSPCMT